MLALKRILLLAPLLSLGCASSPIAWDDAKEVSWRQMSGAYSVLDLNTGRTYRDSSRLRAPSAPNQCPGSVRLWSDHSRAYAAWWSVRPDSGADIVAATVSGGGAWSTPVRLDTLDVSKLGCKRPPPAIVSDDQNNFHVVYPMQAPEGPGLFLSHSMDGGRTFHSPVPIVYGENLGLSSVAADSLLVIVAYEDPNTTPTRISIALSKTMGHLFEYREIVSGGDVAASEPWVAVVGNSVLLQWRRVGGDSTRAIERRGTIR